MSAKHQLTEYGYLSSRLLCSKLSDLCVDKVGVQTGPFGSQLHKEDYVDIGTPIITVEHLGNNRISHIDTPFVTDEDKKRLSKYQLKSGDIVFSRVGSVDRRALVRKEEDGWLFSGRCLRVRVDKTKIDPVYLSYFFGLESFKKYIRSIAVGATMPSINTKILSDIPIYYPECLEEQKRIAHIFITNDEKVNINNQTNQTLEEMAQAIFKSWFVDFDPVKAKMNGEQPEGMDAATASLFPEKLVESELGLIPDGWEIKPIKDLCSKIQNGGTPKRSESSYWDGGDIPWLTSGEVRQSIITSVENRITQLGLDKSSAKWVPELSTLVALYGATAGEVSLTSIPLTTNQAVCALMPKKEHQWYNYLQLKSRVAELAGKAVGSAQQNISKGLVESTEVLSVPESLLEAFNAQVENLFKLRICNLQENVELAKLRDTLLPKLLSGEIELGQTQELIEVE
ncbi:restriction endonuclease subunit S [Vibrio parahaemolyticus]|uniref:restriction endonuclease subunit S n=1 Tax=Vibrio parahaemolyticus TaxID=670 RepID=UPI001121ACEA|nr:restriction endonuclease subunit S [Vibrio parahaemolyticus]EHR1002457.1 restriction endonuclease subunit S [Vibrio parahaemolyticus]EIU6861922.1 restriction endonuclease subunit S [Vibrio parahaemolyticus]EIU7062477.1 restriction endonuclease subunit S [Vibrio parahaemolyticus]EIW7863561.1 restriction endonuclease subunit S [Vibrio parahaemolyticus]ELA7257385.1 restriction endonuclease subunit S [Vibrio parahaemolyticus]